MSEKTKLIEKTDVVFTTMIVVKDSCCMCGNEMCYAGDSEDDILKDIHNDGWTELNSDEYMLIGFWCGCDY